MVADRNSWKNEPLATPHAALVLDRLYSAEEFDRIREGVIPEMMEDKWFVFFESPWLYVHRSWTGICIAQICFAEVSGGFEVTEILVTRDPQQNQSSLQESEALLLGCLLDGWAGRDTQEQWRLYQTCLDENSSSTN